MVVFNVGITKRGTLRSAAAASSNCVQFSTRALSVICRIVWN
jgi:hypothetical protein